MRRRLENISMPVLFAAATLCVLAAIACPIVFALIPARIGRKS